MKKKKPKGSFPPQVSMMIMIIIIQFQHISKVLEHQESQFDHLGMLYIISGNPPTEIKICQ